MLFYAKQLNMRIISIGMGSLDGDPVPKQSGGFEKEGDQIILSKLNRDALVGIAEQTNGHYFEAIQEPNIPQAVYTHIMQLRGASTVPPTHPITPLPIIAVGLVLLLLPFIRSFPWLLAILILNSSVFATLPSHWHTHAAKTAWRNSQYKQAMQHTQTLMFASADPPQWLWYNHGKLHQARGNQLAALSAFSHCDAVYDRALSLYLLGRFSAAMSILKPYIIQTPKDLAARVLFEHAYQNNATIQRYPPVASESVVYPDEGPIPLPFESWSAIRDLDSKHYQHYHQLPTPSMRLEERSW